MEKFCVECEEGIHLTVLNYSVQNFGFPLCRGCQEWIRDMDDETTLQTRNLYLALRLRGVPAELEKYDGFKTIDIAVPEAKVNIEVDGAHHNFKATQALTDLRRTYHSFRKGYFTFRIPNSLVCPEHLDETADCLTEMLELSRDKNRRRTRNHR